MTDNTLKAVTTIEYKIVFVLKNEKKNSRQVKEFADLHKGELTKTNRITSA